MNGNNMISGKLIIISLILVIFISSPALAVPQLPCSFYGMASINGRDAPTGSVITAEIGGLSKGSFKVTEEGVIGGTTFADSKLNVYDGPAGSEILFYIQTPDMANRIISSESATWHSGEINQIELTFTGEEIAKPEEEEADESDSSSGSSGGASGSGDVIVTEGETVYSEEQDFEIEKNTYDISEELSSSGTYRIELMQGDSIIMEIDGAQKTITLKALSEFAALLTAGQNEIIVALNETEGADLDGDGKKDALITLMGINEGMADFVITLIEEKASETKTSESDSGSPTGMAGSNIASGGLYIFIAALALLSAAAIARIFRRNNYGTK